MRDSGLSSDAPAAAQVEEMALNNIVLQQANGIKVVYPITRMFTEPLYNVTRSSNRWEGFRVSASTIYQL